MTDDELIKDFIRVERTAVGVTVLACEIFWPEQHRPDHRWVTASTAPSTATDDEVRSLLTAALHDPRFFAVCHECGQRKPQGWMHDERICSSCAERNHGVIY